MGLAHMQKHRLFWSSRGYGFAAPPPDDENRDSPSSRRGRQGVERRLHRVGKVIFSPKPHLPHPIKGGTHSRDVTWDASRVRRDTLGDALMANAVMVGYALQKGILPVGEDAVRRAIDTLGEIHSLCIALSIVSLLPWGREFQIP